jgi:hypothetical protein
MLIRDCPEWDAALESKKLLADYDAAVAAERAAWRALNLIPTGDSRREAAQADWMAAAERCRQ